MTLRELMNNVAIEINEIEFARGEKGGVDTAIVIKDRTKDIPDCWKDNEVLRIESFLSQAPVTEWQGNQLNIKSGIRIIL